MTVTATHPTDQLASRVIRGALGIKPLWAIAKWQARSMMIKRAERLDIPWRETVATFKQHDWQADWSAVHDAAITYPQNYTASFHGYDQGHLCWDAAFEFEVASNAVHSSLYPEAGSHSDARLRQGYHDVLTARLPFQPQTILDLHCTVGLSAFLLKHHYPQATVTGLDFSPHYLAVAHYQAKQQNSPLQWIHALPEQTGLADSAYDLVSAFLLFHEMPQITTRRIFREVRRLVKPGGCFTFMDMNPQAHAYATMSPHLLTLLKSTEPFMDQYFGLDLEQELLAAGFDTVIITPSSPRHRTAIATVTL